MATGGAAGATEAIHHFHPVGLAALPSGGVDLQAVFTALGGEPTFDALAKARHPPRARTGLAAPAAAAASAMRDLSKIVERLGGDPPARGLATWAELDAEFTLEGPGDSIACVLRLERLLSEATEWNLAEAAKAAAPPAGRMTLTDLPIGAAADLASTLVPAPTDKAAKAADVEARRHALPLKAVGRAATAAAVEAEWLNRESYKNLKAFAAINRVVHATHGLGEEGAKFVASSGRLAQDHSGTSSIVPASLPAARVGGHTRLVRSGTKWIGKHKMDLDAQNDKGVRTAQNLAVVDGIFSCCLPPMATCVELYGGQQAKHQRARVMGSTDDKGAWGDSSSPKDVLKALTFVDAMLSKLYLEGLGMEPARYAKFTCASMERTPLAGTSLAARRGMPFRESTKEPRKLRGPKPL